MRDALSYFLYFYGGIGLVVLLVLILLIFWKGKLNLKQKSQHIRDAHQEIKWDRGDVRTVLIMVPLFLGIPILVCVADLGWLADTICFFVFVFGVFVFWGSTIEQDVFVRPSGITVIPMFGREKDIPYGKIQSITIMKSNLNDDTSKVLVASDKHSVQITDKKGEAKIFLDLVKDKIPSEKFKVENEK